MPLRAQSAKARRWIFIEPFDHYHQVTPFHFVRPRGRIVRRQTKAASLQTFHVHHHSTIFSMQQFHDFALSVDKDKHIAITYITKHLLVYYSAKTIDAFAHAGTARTQVVPHRII